MVSVKKWMYFILFAAVSTACSARTFKILDTSTDLPISDVEVYLVARGTLPGIGHPMEITLAEWNLKSDKNGEVSISSIWANRTHLSSLYKKGYGQTSSVKEYVYRRSEKANKDIHFITPAADLNFEYIKYLAYISTETMVNNKGLAGLPPIMNIAIMYEQAKGKAKTERELAVLNEFCQFATTMKSQAEAGWPDMGTQPEMRKLGQQLIDDCKKSS